MIHHYISGDFFVEAVESCFFFFVIPENLLVVAFRPLTFNVIVYVAVYSLLFCSAITVSSFLLSCEQLEAFLHVLIYLQFLVRF